MKRHFVRAALFAALVCALWLGILLLGGSFRFARPALEGSYTLLQPWLRLCQAVTPAAWQGHGNILLGLMWLITGAVAYSALAGAALAGLAALLDKITQTSSHGAVPR